MSGTLYLIPNTLGEGDAARHGHATERGHALEHGAALHGGLGAGAKTVIVLFVL